MNIETIKFTPGPWHVKSEEGYEHHIIKKLDKQEIEIGFAVLGKKNMPWAEQDANARLMATAPELLEVLEEIIDWQCNRMCSVPHSILDSVLSFQLALSNGGTNVYLE